MEKKNEENLHDMACRIFGSGCIFDWVQSGEVVFQ
jgi:hypothetical protein